MSYWTHTMGVNFCIPEGRLEEAWKNVEQYAEDDLEDRSVKGLLEGMGFEVESESGSLWIAEKVEGPAYDEYAVFEALGEFVPAGRFIEFRGEDSDMWRFYFNGHKMIEKEATGIIWG